MPRDDLTAIAVVLDRSGSMQRLRTDAEGAVNGFIAAQQAEPGDALFTLARFDDQYELVHDMAPLADIGEVELIPRGSTALLDAIGRTVSTMAERIEAMEKDERPGKVVVAVVTDGFENSSKDWTRQSVFELIDSKGWEFLYLSSDRDAIKDAVSYGFQQDHVHVYTADSHGTRLAGAALGDTVREYRSTGKSASIDPGQGG